MQDLILRGIIAGIVAVVFGLIATVIVQGIFPTTNLEWSLIAVGFASFFGGLAGYVAGNYREQQSIT